jgi:hypothetical protein
VGYRAPIDLPALEKGPYRELAKIAEDWSVPHAGAPMLDIVHDATKVRLEVSVNSGIVEGATVQVLGRWPEIVLRSENDDDREGKTQGLTRELQTGDAVFDELVFIESDEPHESIRRILVVPARRAAVLALLRFGALRFGEKGISLRVLDVQVFDPVWLRAHVLVHLRTLADGPRPEPTGRKTPHEAALDLLSKLAMGVLGLAVCVCAVISFDLHRTGVGVLGGISGGALWWLARPAVRRWVRGHSRSHDQYILALIVLFVIMVCGGWMVALFIDATRP